MWIHLLPHLMVTERVSKLHCYAACIYISGHHHISLSPDSTLPLLITRKLPPNITPLMDFPRPPQTQTLSQSVSYSILIPHRSHTACALSSSLHPHQRSDQRSACCPSQSSPTDQHRFQSHSSSSPPLRTCNGAAIVHLKTRDLRSLHRLPRLCLPSLAPHL